MSDLDGARAQIERFTRMWEDDGHGQWAAEELETGRLIGRIGILRHHDWPLEPHDPPEVGWVLHRDWWGRGLATEGGRASLECWRELMLDEPQLYSFTTPDNVRSRAVMERLGLTLRGQTVWRGYDIVWYAVDRSTSASGWSRGAAGPRPPGSAPCRGRTGGSCGSRGRA